MVLRDFLRRHIPRAEEVYALRSAYRTRVWVICSVARRISSSALDCQLTVSSAGSTFPLLLGLRRGAATKEKGAVSCRGEGPKGRLAQPFRIGVSCCQPRRFEVGIDIIMEVQTRPSLPVVLAVTSQYAGSAVTIAVPRAIRTPNARRTSALASQFRGWMSTVHRRVET